MRRRMSQNSNKNDEDEAASGVASRRKSSLLTRRRARRPTIRGGGGGLQQSNRQDIGNILAGLEDDIVDWDQEEAAKKQRNEASKAETIGAGPQNHLDESNLDDEHRSPIDPDNLVLESVPTDKFYLETEKKFAIHNKNLFEKRLEERARQAREAEMKRKFKDELKFQISTPRVALKTHKVMRTLFMLIQGVNIGFLIWQAVIVYAVNVNSFSSLINQLTTTTTTTATTTTTQSDSSSSSSSSVAAPDQLPLFYFFRDLIMPVHCLTYFFLAICIVDCLDR